MSSVFDGHSIFVWQVKSCTGGRAANSQEAREHIWSVMQQVGLRTIYPKVADNSQLYNLSPVGYRWVDDILPALFDMLRIRGCPCVGWHYIYGNDPVAEADIAIQRTKQLGLEGYILDAEQEYKKAPKSAARQFIRRYREQCPDVPLALCSYRFPSLHGDFPWWYFLSEMDAARGDCHMPQVYWLGDSRETGPGEQLRRSYQELMALKELPYYPVGAIWEQQVGDDLWASTPEQIKNFASTAHDLNLPGISWWDWDKIQQQDSVLPQDTQRGWWEALKWTSNLFGGTPEPEPIPEPTWEESIDAWARTMGYQGPKPG